MTVQAHTGAKPSSQDPSQSLSLSATCLICFKTLFSLRFFLRFKKKERFGAVLVDRVPNRKAAGKGECGHGTVGLPRGEFWMRLSFTV